MNPKLKYVIFAACCTTFLVALAWMAEVRQREKTCQKVAVRIENDYNNYFISTKEVEDIITVGGTDNPEGLKKEEFSLRDLELRIKSHKFVKNAQVFRDHAGNVNVSIEQSRPIARIIRGNSFGDRYLDEEGNLLPLSDRYTARVLPVTGPKLVTNTRKDFFQDSTGLAYLSLIRYIEQDAFWNAQIAQMYIDGRGKVILMPQVGDQNIEFGRPEDIERKFRKLMIFYKKILPNVGWDKYSRINVEFNDQIICE